MSDFSNVEEVTSLPYHINAYLESKHTTMFLNWDVTDKEERAIAVGYIYSMIEGILAKGGGEIVWKNHAHEIRA